MDWEQMRPSSNVEDRRGGVGGGVAIGGGGLIIALIASFLFGGNPLDYLNGAGPSGAPTPTQQYQQPYQQTPANDRNADFARRILGDTEDVWGSIFQKSGKVYQPAPLVLFSGATNSGCGGADAAVGPFYCPVDQKVYIDLSFFQELEQRFGAGGDFARAYVIAHEVGHHVQDLLGIQDQVSRQQASSDQRTSNALSVRLELQADCLAGVWGAAAQQRGLINVADIKQAINAASAIGDDRLQKESQGYVVPDAFTHGTSAQRVAWFERGLQGKSINSCDTFSQ